MKITEKKYGDGTNEFTEITLENAAGMTLVLSSCGAGIRDVFVPDKHGVRRLVTLRPDDETRMTSTSHGKTIGRTSGRIAGAEFTIDGKTAHLEKNNHGTDNLHGGAAGFKSRVFGHKITRFDDRAEIEFTYFSPDGEGGYFGNVTLAVTYAVYERENTFDIRYCGTTDTKTLLSITNHVYWNLSGDLRETVNGQTLFLAASRVGYLNERSIAEEIRDVTPEFDFRREHKIGEYIDAPDVLRVTGGYDHPFFLDADREIAAALADAQSGIRLEIATDYPCIVVYTNNYAHEGEALAGGHTDKKRLAICLECQYHPDGIHVDRDNCGIFSPDKPYRNTIRYSFKTA